MKKLTLLLLSTTLVFGCKKEDEAAGDSKPEASKTAAGSAKAKASSKAKAPPAPKMEMAPIDIVHEDFKATMDAPKGATFKESYGTLEVKLGDGTDFFVQIETEADFAAAKKFAMENDVQKLKKFHTETDDTLIYETEAMRRTSFWLDTVVKVGDKTVHCKSGRGAPSFTLAQVTMFDKACKSLKPKQ